MAKALNSRIRLPYLHTPAYPGCCGVHSSARSWITTSIKRGRISKARDGKLSLNPQLSFGEDDLPQLLSDSGSCTFHLKLTDHSIVMLCDAFHTNDFNPVNRISTPPVVYPSQRALHKHSAIFYNFILYGLLNGTNSANGVIGRWRSVLRGYLDILVKIAKYIGIFSECILLSLSERDASRADISRKTSHRTDDMTAGTLNCASKCPQCGAESIFTPLCRPWYTDAILHQGLPVKSSWLQDTQKDIRLQDD
ncbi:predicted protein [Histoplasma capsulatum H143]|uniref:Uncharacterized protein n=1 Tax=Ajellomyces capsulatus (strain H143) TaxID=544712 RepID=C6HSW0_AJECH|nr:predicted protein [Histoplasma capsulatum H143]